MNELMVIAEEARIWVVALVMAFVREVRVDFFFWLFVFLIISGSLTLLWTLYRIVRIIYKKKNKVTQELWRLDKVSDNDNVGCESYLPDSVSAEVRKIKAQD